MSLILPTKPTLFSCTRQILVHSNIAWRLPRCHRPCFHRLPYSKMCADWRAPQACETMLPLPKGSRRAMAPGAHSFQSCPIYLTFSAYALAIIFSNFHSKVYFRNTECILGLYFCCDIFLVHLKLCSPIKRIFLPRFSMQNNAI